MGARCGQYGRQLDQVDAALWSCQESPDIRPFVTGRVIPDDVDDAFVGIADLDFGEKLRGADPVDGDWLDKRRVKGLKVQCAMEVHPATPCCGFDRRV